MEAGAIGVRLTSAAVVPLIRKLFVRDGPGAGLVEEPVRISALVSFRGERRTLDAPRVRKLAGELVERALHGVPPGERPVTEDEREAVTDALASSLLALGELDMEDVQAVRLGHRAFARSLHAAHPAATRELSADAARFHGTLLECACLHVLHFFTQRSTFVARSLVEHSRQLEELVAKTDRLLSRNPALLDQDARFEHRYAGFLAQKHSTLTIHGLDLQQCREWPLDAAYLSLEAVGREEPAVHIPGMGAGMGPDPSRPDPVRLPADQMLARHERVLLHGVAGSGKTTLVQWLAVATARQEALRTTPGMAYLLGRVAFVLPLRRLTRDGAQLPSPDRFLSAAGLPLSGSQPDGWADRVLSDGRGLLLVDGIDEVPEREREPTRRWLRDLLAAFPGNLWLVTSRPSAVRADWLAAEGFGELTLSRMGRTEVASFVHRWHEAAQAGPAMADALLRSVRAQQDLGRLATNPLMCGLICALHRERRGFLPRGRKALYDAALSMLLERRDRERDMRGTGGIDLDEESQTELLQKLAYWLIRNGRAEMSQTDATELLDRVLPSMPHVTAQGSASQILRHLLERSGLLREPAPDAVDFVHRTFQDYLGAREAVQERDFELLVRHAHLDQWEDVLRLAVAHARPDERARLLRGLTDRGDAEPEWRTRLFLLATACLEHATKLAPEVREEVERRAATLIPPRTIDEAKQLAAAGPVVLGLLPGPDGLEVDEAEAVAHTACQIGGDAALPTLTRFLDHPNAAVRGQLGGHWDRFDTEVYAEEVLRSLGDGAESCVIVRSPKELALLPRLGPFHSVRLHGDFTAAQILDNVDPSRLADLRLVDNTKVTELRFLRAFPDLQLVDLETCPHVEDLSPLSDLPVRKLRLWRMKGLAALAGADSLVRLDYLFIGPGTGCRKLSWLPRSRALTQLGLPEEAELTGLEAWAGLEWLGLHQRWMRPLSPSELRSIRELPRLTRLTLHPDLIVGRTGSEPLLPGLRELDVGGFVPAIDTAWIPGAFPGLEKLILRDKEDVDLAPLAELPRLREILLSRTRRTRNADRLPPEVKLIRLPRPRRTVEQFRPQSPR